MLTLRPSQVQVFSEAALKRFEDRMVVHLNKFFPGQCKTAAEPELRATIQYGIKRAAAYGIVGARDVCKYIDLMILFGRDFDKDPELPWASAALSATYPQGPSAKLNWLYDSAKENRDNKATKKKSEQNV
jgi:hypothetical protein